MLLGGLPKIAGIHIAQGNDIDFAGARDRSEIRSAATADSDAGDINPVIC